MATRPITDVPPTPKQIQDIVNWLGKGAIIGTAIAKAGVAQVQFDRWLRAGAAGQEPFATFAATVDHALMEFEGKLLCLISDSAEKNVNAAQWLFNIHFGAKYKKASEIAAGLGEIESPRKREFTEEEVAAAEQRAFVSAGLSGEPPPPKKPAFGLEPYGGHKSKH